MSVNPPPSRRWLVFMAAMGLCVLPLGLVHIPPLVDYPNHLARIFTIAKIDSCTQLARYYEVKWAVLPNLAMDMLVPPLLNLIPVYTGGKCFIILLFFLLVGGTMALHQAIFKTPSYWPLLAFLFLYNRHLLWGFMNFLFGTGLCLWILAGWIGWRNRSGWFRLTSFAVMAVILFFSHLFALGVYGLCILGYTFYRHQSEEVSPVKEWGIALSQFLVPAILFLFFSPTAQTTGLEDIRFGALTRKISGLVQPLHNYSHALDGGTFLMLAGLFIAGILTGRIKLARAMGYPLGLLLVFFLIMPERLLTVQAVDSRIPTPFAFLLVAGTRPLLRLPRPKPLLPCLIVALFVVRMAVISGTWYRADRIYGDYLQAINQIEPNSRLFTAIASPGYWKPLPVPLHHFPCIAIIEKAALVPTLFAYPSQQPIRYQREYKALAQSNPEPRFQYNQPPAWEAVAKEYDYMLIITREVDFEPPPEKGRYKRVYHGKGFDLLLCR